MARTFDSGRCRLWRAWATLALVSALTVALAGCGAAAQPAEPSRPPQGIHAFVAAYPDFLDRVEKGILHWRDGTRMPLSALGLDKAGKPRVRYAAAGDPLVAATEAISAVDYEPIFLKMYGDCRKGGMMERLAEVRWNRAAPDGGETIRAARANGVAAALQRVSDALNAMPELATLIRRPLGGTYNCRTIAESDRLSLHGFGIAIDVNPDDDGYWLTAPTGPKGQPIRHEVVPPAVVEAFEREGFVWGGRWNQFDTFHFEYRPEYRIAAGGTLPERLTRTTFTAFFGGRARSAGIERMSFVPRAPGKLTCHRWVRQPGKNFGKCLSKPTRIERPKR